MQNAETVLSIIRERGRRGLPLERLYRQLFNRELFLLAYGRIYSNKGAMTPGVTGETVDGMSLAKIDAIIGALRAESLSVAAGQAGLHPEEELLEEAPAGHADRGRTSWSLRWYACCLRRITTSSSPAAPTDSAPDGVATPRWMRWCRSGRERTGSSRGTSPTASGQS